MRVRSTSAGSGFAFDPVNFAGRERSPGRLLAQLAERARALGHQVGAWNSDNGVPLQLGPSPLMKVRNE
jgi:hypothetical protein